MRTSRGAGDMNVQDGIPQFIRMGDRYGGKGFVQRFRMEQNGECFVTLTTFDRYCDTRETTYPVSEVLKMIRTVENPQGVIVWQGEAKTGSRWIQPQELF